MRPLKGKPVAGLTSPWAEQGEVSTPRGENARKCQNYANGTGEAKNRPSRVTSCKEAHGSPNRINTVALPGTWEHLVWGGSSQPQPGAGLPPPVLSTPGTMYGSAPASLTNVPPPPQPWHPPFQSLIPWMWHFQMPHVSRIMCACPVMPHFPGRMSSRFIHSTAY